MQVFLVTQQFQDDFVSALRSNTVADFWRAYRDDLMKLATFLEAVKVPNRKANKHDQVYDKVSIFICKNVLELMKELVNPGTLEVPRDRPAEVFRQWLVYESRIGKDWPVFYEIHEQFLDTIILWARRQHILHIYIERNGGKYRFLKDARLSRNRILEEEEQTSGNWFCCLPERKNAKPLVMLTQPAPINYQQVSPARGYISQPASPPDITQYHVPVQPQVPYVIERPHDLQKSGSARNSNKTDKKKNLENFDSNLKNKVGDSVPREIPKQRASSPSTFERVGVHRTPSLRSEASLEWEQRQREMDESFHRKLNAQNVRHQEQMRNLRAERERINREAEETIRKLREESAKRIRFFLQCVMLKIRWEGQQDEWEKMLKAARDPVLKVKSRFLDFTGKSFVFIKRQYEGDELRSALLDFQKHVQIAYDKLVDDFGDLAALSEKYEDKLFLKVLQRIICGMADKLCLLLEALEGFENDEASFSRIKNREVDIYAWDIPTASGLRRICDTAKPEDYKFVSPPTQPRRSNGIIITEI